MEQETRRAAAELDAEGERVLAALETVEDAVCRVMLTLHFYRGLPWKEVGAVCGVSEHAAKSRTIKAMRKAIPK